MAKRNVSQRCLDAKPSEAAGGKHRAPAHPHQAGDRAGDGEEDHPALKDSKIKVQAQIQDDQLRVTGKDRDALQGAIALMRKNDFGIDLQYVNFRD